MPLNGSGVYTPPGASFPAVPNTVIASSKFNNIINDLAAALSVALFRDGQAAMTGPLDMGTQDIENAGLIEATDLAVAGPLRPYTSGATAPAIAGVPEASYFGSAAVGGGAPATSGTTDSFVGWRQQLETVALDLGVYSGGEVWLQARLATNFATNFPILVNPNGGNIGLGDKWSILSGVLTNNGNTQPSFHAYSSAEQTSGTVFIFGTEVHDRGGCYNNATGVFTAPVAGLYHFDATPHLNTNTATGSAAPIIRKNSSVILAQSVHYVSTVGSLTEAFPMSVTAYLAANDTVRVEYLVGFGGGGVMTASNNIGSQFSGYLVG